MGGVNQMRERDKIQGVERGEERKGKKRGRHLFHTTAFNLSRVVKLADNTDSFAKVSDEQSHTTDTPHFRPPPVWNGG